MSKQRTKKQIRDKKIKEYHKSCLRSRYGLLKYKNYTKGGSSQ